MLIAVALEGPSCALNVSRQEAAALMTPFVAAVAGILLMVVCGRFCRVTLNRLFDAARPLAAAD